MSAALRLAALPLAALLVAGCGLDTLVFDGAIPKAPQSLGAAFSVRPITVEASSFSASAHSAGPVAVAEAGFTIPLAGKRQLRCRIHPAAWNLATQVQAELRALGTRERVGLVRTEARIGASGRPYFVAEALYGPSREVRGVAQFGVFGSSEGTVACATDGNARSAEMLAVVEELAESQRWADEDGREKPVYAETKLVNLGEVPVGFEYRYLRRRGGKRLSWFKVRGLTGRVGDAALTAIDDVTIERLDDDRHVTESHEVLTSDGKKSYDVVVQREPDGSFVAAGTVGDRVIRRPVSADKPIESDLSMAPLLRALVDGKAPKATGRRVLVEGTDVRLVDETFTRKSASTIVSADGLTFAVDERGFVQRTEEEGGSLEVTMRIERVRVVGAIP